MSGESKLETLGNNAGVNGRTGGAKGPAVLRRGLLLPPFQPGEGFQGRMGEFRIGRGRDGRRGLWMPLRGKKTRKSNTSRMLSAEARVLLAVPTPRTLWRAAQCRGGANRRR